MASLDDLRKLLLEDAFLDKVAWKAAEKFRYTKIGNPPAAGQPDTRPSVQTALLQTRDQAGAALRILSDKDAFAAAIAAKLPAGSVDAATVQQAVRDVLGSLNDEPPTP